MKKIFLSLATLSLLFIPKGFADTVVMSGDKVNIPVKEGSLQMEVSSIDKDKETGHVFSIWNFTLPKTAPSGSPHHIRMLTESNCSDNTISIVAGIAFSKKDKPLGLFPETAPMDIHQSFIFEAVQDYACNVTTPNSTSSTTTGTNKLLLFYK